MLSNWFKTTLLMAALTALFMLVGGALGGQTGMLIALLFAAGTNLWAYWSSDRMVLRMYNAQEVDEHGAPQLYRVVRELSERAGLPMPRVYIIPDDAPNAFATGRNPQHAAVAVTSGILRLLSARELRGVLAHELAHVRHRDILISTLAATVAGAIAALAQFGQLSMLFGGQQRENNGVLGVFSAMLVIILAPVAAMLIQMAVSRTREFGADRGGAEISGDPLALAAALEKIEQAAHQVPLAGAEAHPTTAQMMIVNPLRGEDIMRLFATHPNTGERIERLHYIARDMGVA
ncbi:zinc metalloprotease HtpX [Thermithiobacillus tepidarius DSM 3134]|uniref:zinc metalloprotease HtpX n=1 Tax=Thermithiobacillus tepidarius TaxID=929 RepID=UPI00041BB678|nr:zinc metalloprotease HtpX [Thermithiobacillus tepidarius]